MASRALRRGLLPLGVVHLVASDAGRGRNSRNLKPSLPCHLHPRLRRFRVAIKAGSLGRLGGLFRPDRVMARPALVGCPLLMELVLELHISQHQDVLGWRLNRPGDSIRLGTGGEDHHGNQETNRRQNNTAFHSYNLLMGRVKPVAGRHRAQLCASRATLALVMPTHKRHFGLGYLQFLTRSTYHRAELLESDRFRPLAAELRSAPAPERQGEAHGTTAVPGLPTVGLLKRWGGQCMIRQADLT
jgi:hypothetical protein